MKTKYISCIILFCLLSYTTVCLTKRATSTSEHNHQILPNDSKWNHYLYSKLDSFKGIWIDDAAEYPSYFNEKGIPFSRERFKKFKVIPLSAFIIDEKTFKNFNGTLSAGDIKIDSSKADFYIYEQNYLIIRVETTIKEGQISLYSNGVFGEYIPKTISKLSDKEKKSLRVIHVNCYEGSSYQKEYIVFTDKKGQLMNIDVFGQITPLEKKLQKLRETGHSDF